MTLVYQQYGYSQIILLLEDAQQFQILFKTVSQNF